MARNTSRRVVLRALGLSSVGAAGFVIAGCRPGGGLSDSAGGGDSDTEESTTSTEGSGDEAGGDTAGDTGGGSDLPGECETAEAWAAGGTASMTAAECYPDPFTDAPCQAGGLLLCETTAGPCTSDSIERQDISEGLLGLPVRLALQIVDEDCTPIAGARVEVWHTQRAGIYSGETPGGSICNRGDASAEDQLSFRGHQVSDADGRVDFDSCYPGWYAGRAIHIHFSVTTGDTHYLVSQLLFADSLNDEICGTHPDYAERGEPDTNNEQDGVFQGLDHEPYVLQTQRMTDGAMLAWKRITVRPGGPGCA